MRVLQLFNQQRSGGGEENVVLSTVSLLRRNGAEVHLHMPSSRDIGPGLGNRAQVALSGIYNPSSFRSVSALIEDFSPDIAHAHNLYPLLSPSALRACRVRNIPVVMTVHSHSLTCPTWYHFYDGGLCFRCVGGHEFHCVAQNCRGNILESAAYAMRTAAIRRLDSINKNVDVFLAVSRYMEGYLTEVAGIPAEKVRVVENGVRLPSSKGPPASSGAYVAYAGRLSPEKGVEVLLEAAALTPEIPYRIAGDGPERTYLERIAPENVSFMGHLDRDRLGRFIEGARFFVIPSLSNESASLAAAEALSQGRPVVASRLGALPEVVIDGQSGRLVDPNNVLEIVRALEGLWRDGAVTDRMGAEGRRIVEAHYTEGHYISRLLRVYGDLLERSRVA